MTNTTDEQKMPLLEHLIEFRRRLLWSVLTLLVAFLASFAVAEHLFEFLASPLAEVMRENAVTDRETRLIFTDLTEVFFTYVKVAFFFGAFVSCPIFLSQIWLFVAPGLYKNEKTAFAPFLIASPILFFIGGALVYYVIFPMAAEFFLGFQVQGSDSTIAIELEAKVNEYFSLMMKLIFAFGICFQLPVLMTLLAKVGIASSKGMAEKRKYAIVGVFIVAAIFTPPDPLSQLALAIPIVLLYEISILMAKMVEKKRAEEEKAESTNT
ncbi:MAG: twin-arginine translocase subunit TatC [Halopseudomonas aestusnigri]